MSRLFPVLSKRFQVFLQKREFMLVRQKGSHQIWQHSDGRTTVLPVHSGEDLGKGMIRTMLNQIEVDLDEYLRII